MSNFNLPLRGVLGLYTLQCVENSSFDPTILQHYQRLRSDFMLLCPPSPEPAPPTDGSPKVKELPDESFRRSAYKRGSELVAELDKPNAHISNAELYTLESVIVGLSSLESLKQGYQSLQNRYRALAGAEVYKEYLTGQRPAGAQRPLLPPVVPIQVPGNAAQGDAAVTTTVVAPVVNNDIEIYRADSLFLLREIRRYSILVPRREQIRRWLLIDVLTVTLTTVLGFTLSIVLEKHTYFPVMRLVSIAALLGGLVSVLQRIQTIPEDQLILSLWNRISVVLSPLTAIVFAHMLYAVFEANFVTGAFFPSIAGLYCVWNSGTTCIEVGKEVKSLYDLFATVSHSEFSKLIVWSFIAGFSERFVPDTLNGLIERQKTASSK